MNNRIYNILFHTHTVSGILISIALYVIFFAGSFAFFKDEMLAWERNEPVAENIFEQTDLNRLLDTLSRQHDMYGRDIALSQYNLERRISIGISASKDTTVQENETGRDSFFGLDTETYQEYDYRSSYSLAEFMYRLHFFAQLNLLGRSGYMLAGLVSFFFLFAIITGIWIHWNKIVSNFYLFRPAAKLKTLWTDAHTALGVLGFPYQFMYALTGVYFIVGTTVIAPPVVAILYNDDAEKLYQDMGFNPPEFPFAGERQTAQIDVNAFMAQARQQWGDYELVSVNLLNYGDANMHVAIEGKPAPSSRFTGKGMLVFKAGTGEIVSHQDPYTSNTYLDGATEVIRKLHFGDFGGLGMRLVYFVLGMVSCFVIISGIMIWLVARDKKSTPQGERRFNAWVVWSYLAVCLSMYPVTAFTFLAVKLFLSTDAPERMTFIYQVFFYSWLVLSILFTASRDNYFINKYTLLAGSLLGLMVPVANGIVTGNWFWKTFSEGAFQLFFIDIFWLLLSVTTLLIVLRINRKSPQSDSRFIRKALVSVEG